MSDTMTQRSNDATNAVTPASATSAPAVIADAGVTAGADVQPPNPLTLEERVTALEARMRTIPARATTVGADVDAGSMRVPKWMLWLALAAVVFALVLALFTLPSSPLAQLPAPTSPNLVAIASPAPTLSACPITPSTSPNANASPAPTLVPLGIASTSRSLGDPNAKLALVEYGDFQ